MLKSILLVAVCASALCVPSLWAQPQGPPPAKVVLDLARLEKLERLREVTGELRPARQSLIAAEEPGIVRNADFKAGDPVKAGQVLVTLDDKLASLAVKQAEADVKVAVTQIADANALLVKAQRDLTRAEELMSRSIETQRTLDDAKTVLEQAQARVEQRQAEIEAAEVRLERAREIQGKLVITVPFDGVIVEKHAEAGEWLRAGDPVVLLVALDQVEAWLDVPQQLVARLAQADLQVHLRIAGLETELNLPINRLVPQGDSLSRTFPARVVIENPEGTLQPGMSVVALVPTGESEPTMTVHKDAVLRDSAGEFIYIDAGGQAQVSRIRILYAHGDRVAVRSPTLTEGTGVIVEGNERVFPGQPLMSAAPAANK